MLAQCFSSARFKSLAFATLLLLTIFETQFFRFFNPKIAPNRWARATHFLSFVDTCCSVGVGTDFAPIIAPFVVDVGPPFFGGFYTFWR